MCNPAHPHVHPHPHEHSHSHAHPAHGGHYNHVEPGSRRDFLRMLMGTALAGASAMELAYHRAAWANAAAPTAAGNLFNLQKAAEGIFFAQAHPQAQVNCNAAIFVRSKDVVVVDAHSKPSAAASLIQQIRHEVTTKPVRYVINTHFHWDHTQGDHAYRSAFAPLDFIASSMTKQLMSELAVRRVKESLDAVPPRIEQLRKRAEASHDPGEKAFCADQIRQLEAYQSELSHYTLELPTITFDKTYLLQDAAYDLHLDFHGRAHTAGDIFVFCPSRRVLASGDVSHGWLPSMGDAFPRAWPHTIDEAAKIDFKYLLGGHGLMRSDRIFMTGQRNYIEEITERVAAGKQAGQSLGEMQKRITVASLRSLQANNYGELLERSLAVTNPHYGPMPPLQNGVNGNLADVYKNLDRV
jgi:glyoxylase-like metal-dependent hydrolase (beta-lactamase superfamily II)